MTHNVKWLKLRLFVVMGVFFMLFGVVFLRAFEVQVMDSGTLKKQAKRQHEKTITRLARRGVIYDKNLNELAVSLDVDSVYANPRMVKKVSETAEVLSRVVGTRKREVAEKLKSRKNFVWIKRKVDITDEDRRTVKALDGINTIKNSKRFYPNRHVAANLIGFEGIDASGLEGVELYYDKYLKGSARKVIGERDARGRTLLYEDVEKTAMTSGMDVVMTIDKTIQHIAEKAVGKAVKESGAKGGMAIVIEPESGEILAMAVNPTYDPNNFHRYGPSNWRNRAVTDSLEPGSIMKPFLLAAVLEDGVAGEHDIFYCEKGSYRVADRVFHDLHEHGWLSVAHIIKYSSNIGAAKLGEKVGRESLYNHYKNFGFGAKTGVDLPGEGRGALRHYKNWSGVTLQTLSFGQGVSVTGIQLVAAYSALANGGRLVKPYAVKRVVGPDGAPLYEETPEEMRRVLSEENSKLITKILKGVTGEKGTGRRAGVDGFEVAGKTGTAQKPDFKKGGYKKDAYIASFVGYLPADDPELVILVMIDEPEGEHTGGRWAAPAFREIASESLAYMGVFPEGSRLDETEGPQRPFVMEVRNESNSLYEDIKAGRVPDFRGKTIRRVLQLAARVEAEVEVKGSGVAIRQNPAPGGKFTSEKPVEVWFH